MGCVASSENGDREERRRRRREKKNNNGRSSRHDETPTRYKSRGGDADSDGDDTEGRPRADLKSKAKKSESRRNQAIPAPADSDGEESRRASSDRDVPKKKTKKAKKQQPSSVDPLYTVSSAATRKSCLKQPNKTPPSAVRTRDSSPSFGSRGPATPSTVRSGVNTPTHADSPYTQPIGSCASLSLPGTPIVVGDTPPLPVPGLAVFEENRRSPKAATPYTQHNAAPHGTPHCHDHRRHHHRRERDVCDVHAPEVDGGRSHHDSAHSLSAACLTEAALAMHVATTSHGTTLSNGRAVSTPHTDGKKTKRPGIMRWIADCRIDGSNPSPRVVECQTGFSGGAMSSLAKGSPQAIEMELYEELSRAGSVSSSGTRRSFLE